MAIMVRLVECMVDHRMVLDSSANDSRKVYVRCCVFYFSFSSLSFSSPVSRANDLTFGFT